jgi:hypothetical protein
MPDTGSGFTYFRSGAEREADTEAQGTPEQQPKQEADTEPKTEVDAYPTDGTIPEVKRWVGEDTDRAQVALDREGDRENPRSTLVDYLQDMLADDDDDS